MLNKDEEEMILRIAKLIPKEAGYSEILNKFRSETGSDLSTAMNYAPCIIKLIREEQPSVQHGDISKKEELNFNLKDRFSSTKTALKPMPENKGPRKPPGYNQLHNDMNIKPYCTCAICGSGVDCMGAACPNCNADSTNFLQGDPKTKRDTIKQKAPQPQQIKNMPLQAIAVVLDNKKKDDKKPFDNKLVPYNVEIGGSPTEEKSFEEHQDEKEKSFSDPYDEKNSDKNHIESVERTMKELCGE